MDEEKRGKEKTIAVGEILSKVAPFLAQKSNSE
jgi:hypothetical protein